MKLSKIRLDILRALVAAGRTLTAKELRTITSRRVIGVNTLRVLRERDCIRYNTDRNIEITDIGRTAAETGIRP